MTRKKNKYQPAPMPSDAAIDAVLSRIRGGTKPEDNAHDKLPQYLLNRGVMSVSEWLAHQRRHKCYYMMFLFEREKQKRAQRRLMNAAMDYPIK